MTESRTCAACGGPIAESLRGFAGSLLACDAHLAQWLNSSERAMAQIEALCDGRAMGAGPFNAWARKQQAVTP